MERGGTRAGSDTAIPKVPIPPEILNNNRGLIDLKLSDKQVAEIKEALDEYKNMVAMEEFQLFHRGHATASHWQTDSNENTYERRRPKRNTTAKTIPASGYKKIVTKR